MRSGADLGVTSKPERADSHGNRAPLRPLVQRHLLRGGETAEPVLEHRPCGGGPGGGEERKGEGIGIPENVTAVTLARQSSRPDRRFTLLGNRDHHVEEREPRGQLQLVVTLDADVCVVPSVAPRLAVLGEQLVEAGLGGFPGAAYRKPGVGWSVGGGRVCHHAVEHRRLVAVACGVPLLMGGGGDPTAGRRGAQRGHPGDIAVDALLGEGAVGRRLQQRTAA